jgi:radical SAM superfamily enzyme YgiQ (UPF0313 family)
MALKILFAFYPLFVDWNHGIALLSQLCKNRGIETELYILRSPSRFYEYLQDTNYDYVCFSSTIRPDLIELEQYIIVAECAGHKILLGGTHFSLFKEFKHKHPVCLGDGETLPDFLLNGDDSLFKKKLVCKDINSLPLPDYELFDGIKFNRKVEGYSKIVPYVSSRGCSEHCSFCQIRYQPPGVRIRFKMGEELSYLKERYNPDLFWILDATPPYFSSNWRISWGEFRHDFVCYIRGNIKPHELEFMIDRGMKVCLVGFESGNERYRNEVLKKNLTDEEIWRTVDILKKHNVVFVPFFMNKTPGETPEIATETISMANKMNAPGLLWEYKELISCQ